VPPGGARRHANCQGDQDVTGFIAAIRATGYAGPWGVEILSEDFRHLAL
jgi:sugar phosphate isomerase/epimerase